MQFYETNLNKFLIVFIEFPRIWGRIFYRLLIAFLLRNFTPFRCGFSEMSGAKYGWLATSCCKLCGPLLSDKS